MSEVKQAYQKKLNTHSEFNVKDIDTTGRVITVYYSAFNNKDRDDDVIVKGSFVKTIKEQGPEGIGEIWHLINHKAEKHVARPFELMEDNYGLLARVKMPNTTLGNDTLELYKDGHYRHHSIGFKTIKQTKKSDYNEISEIQLFEGSSVLWAANPAATTVGVKSLTKEQLIKDMDATIKSLRNGVYTDETFGLLEIQLRQLQQEFIDLSTTQAVEQTLEPEKKDDVLLLGIKSINQLFKN